MMADADVTSTAADVLLVEDDPDDARAVFVGLADEHHLRIHHVRTGAAALEALDRKTFAAVLVDHRLPDTTGVELIRALRAAGHGQPTLMVSGVREDRIVANALEAGADDFVVKDLDYADVLPELLRGWL